MTTKKYKKTVLLPSRVSPEVMDWVKRRSSIQRRTASQFVFLLLEDAMLAEKGKKS